MKLKNIKDSFNEREIQPSADSWERLSAQLDGAEKKKKRPYLYWLGAVAAVLIIAIMVYPVLSGTVAPDNNKQLVIENPVMEQKEPIENVESGSQIEIALEIDIHTEQETTSEKEEKTRVVKKMPATPQVQQAIAQTHSTKEPISKIEERRIDNKTEISFKDTAVASIDSQENIERTENIIEQNEYNSLSPSQEADILLMQLLGEKKNTGEVATQSVKPEQLLRETEWDIESNRRNRINNGLKDGLGKLKNEAFALIGRDN